MNKEDNSQTKRLYIGIAVVILLLMGLCITTFAWNYATEDVNENQFQTKDVSVDLNGGQPVITTEDLLFAPGRSVEKSFYVHNNSGCAVWLRFYFEEISGDLAKAIRIEIYNSDNGQLVCTGLMSEMTRDKVDAADQLEIGAERTYRVKFSMDEEAGNEYQNTTLDFDFCVDAVQTNNNPNRKFEGFNQDRSMVD